jgi:hypothetical protein
MINGSNIGTHLFKSPVTSPLMHPPHHLSITNPLLTAQEAPSNLLGSPNQIGFFPLQRVHGCLPLAAATAAVADLQAQVIIT